MLRAKVLNSEAILNSYEVLGSLDVIPGSAFTLAIQIYLPQNPNKIRYFPDIGATLIVHLPKTDGTSVDVTMANIGDDRSLWTGDILATDSEDLVGGNFTFTLSEGAKDTIGVVEVGISIVLTGSCC